MKKLLLIFCFPILCFSQQSFNFIHDGTNREYIYYSPNNLPVNAPLVFVAHGFTGSAIGIMGYSGMNTIADQNGFAVCYPKGTVDKGTLPQRYIDKYGSRSVLGQKQIKMGAGAARKTSRGKGQKHPQNQGS